MMSRKILIFTLVASVFLIARLPAVHQIYHQDEYKWAMQADPAIDAATPHPPIGKYTLRLTGDILGFDNLRFDPLLFSLLNLVLVYLIIKKLTNKTKIALLGAALFSINVYSVIASLQIDIDGAILPFFILLAYYAYLQLFTDDRKFWWIIFGIGVVGGFLTKLSFIIFVGALVVDYLLILYYSGRLNIKRIIVQGLKLVGIFVLFVIGLYYFNPGGMNTVIEYGRHFQSLDFASRAYFELGFKILKSLVWLSPLLLLPVIGGLFNREVIKKYQFWYIFLFFNLIFYLVMFDFAKLTVERYLMFLIVPCCVISAGVLGELMEGFNWHKDYKKVFFISLAFVLLSIVILSIPHSVLPLDPKINYVNHIKNLDFNFLIPLTGGSGPVGFYFSAQYILWSWAVSVVSLAWVICAKRLRRLSLAVFLIFGIGYNAIFLNEYLFGSLFGSVPNVAKASVQYVLDNPKIKDATTYYDTGNYYLILADKSAGRFFTAPSRDYSGRFKAYKGYYMIVDFPAIDRNGRYWPFLERCKLDKQFTDKDVNSYIFDCTGI
ncbi:MAG: glycosyltransferase family 39 protein [Patescibacteria group bacterium]